MSVRCSHCGFSNAEDADRCRECGEPLAPLKGEMREPGSQSAPEDTTTQVTPPRPDDAGEDPTVGPRSSLGDLRPGDTIDDRYRILELVGSGGMGEVYRAEQVEPVRRQVALKVVKLGMDTRQVVKRFESERQALALMEHTNIARVFDGGATPTGRPYFVMEYVKGEPITDYCDRHNLSTADRLKLFRTVCDAVQHAHQKGIIHRDLKPSNVLVTVEGDTPVPKIIDFGIAKATGARLTEETLFTTTGELMGTPEYMSPEQAEMSALDVDTRTDIYSLGVVLYELLVGALPFDPQQLRKAALGEIRRIIRETEPPRPSTRFSELGETRETIARCRRTDPAALARSLKGDLEWLILKAMEKDRTRRYASASELAGDIERHLKHEPIIASPPSRLYRMRKYVRRHRMGVSAAALVVLALVAGVVGTTVGLVRARRATAQAEREAETARQVSDFLVDMFEVSDPGQAHGEEISAREVLDRGAKKIDTELADRPQVRARLLRTMGKVYSNLALYDQADSLLEDALAIDRGEFGANSLEAAAVLHDLAGLREREGRYRKALGLAQQALDIKKQLLGEEDPSTASTLCLVGGIDDFLGDYDQARAQLRRSLEINMKLYGEESTETAKVLQNLANLNNHQGRYAEAERLHRRALRILEKCEGELHPDVVQALVNLGLDCYRQNKLVEAHEALSRGLELAVKLYGDTHTAVGNDALNLGMVELAQGHLERAEELFKRALKISEKLSGADSLDVANALEELGNVQSRREANEDALPFYKRCLHIREVVLGPDHEGVAGALNNVGATYCLMGELRKGKPFLERSLRIREKALGPDHQWVAQSLGNLGAVCMRTGDLEEADQYFKRALKTFRKQLGDKHPNVTSTLWNLAAVHQKMGDIDTARSYFEEAVTLGDETLPPRQFVHLLRQYAGFLQATGEKSRADEVLARAGRILADQGE